MIDKQDSSPGKTTQPKVSPSVEKEALESSVCQFESFEHYPDENMYRAIFDANTVSPSTAVIGVISAVSDKDPLDIDPLYSSIDPDAFDTLMSHQSIADGDVHVAFELAGYDVTVSSYGSVTVQTPQKDITTAKGD
ncbi:HalOD1 output domain-containing protein [Natronosalvus amylolyticus]|uniref:HalOD1 output domain-containing protein n=1 Tax=Natronosalvus amylolyticus TaxID=2961994 RepID=UPI0020C94CA6|nr:HalOD1 output domain-containing protein [Natronosalvus amylolyticus]